jgi:hypothetical protein
LGILGIWYSLILSVSGKGYGKGTDVDQYRLQSRGGKGVINMKATPDLGKDSALASSTRPASSWSSSSSARSSASTQIHPRRPQPPGRQAPRPRTQDKVATAVVIPQKKPKPNLKRERCCNSLTCCCNCLVHFFDSKHLPRCPSRATRFIAEKADTLLGRERF